MVVLTAARESLFDLVPVSAGPGLAYVMRFRFPAVAAVPVTGATPDPQTGVIGRYQLTGERRLRPSGIEDDGVHTYLQWPADAGLPAVYAMDGLGRETLVNGMVRGNMFVIDSVAESLVFRLDDKVARARRLPEPHK
jgi:type IV secretion system protein VirB9